MHPAISILLTDPVVAWQKVAEFIIAIRVSLSGIDYCSIFEKVDGPAFNALACTVIYLLAAYTSWNVILICDTDYDAHVGFTTR